MAFEERKQEVGESFDAFLIAIKTLARDADLCDSCLDRRLVTKIMSGIRDKETRMKLLAISPLPDLQKVIDLCRSEESAKRDETRMGRTKPDRTVFRARAKSKDIRNSTSCKRCGRSTCPPNGQSVCPAKGKTCSICYKNGHFASVCFHRPKSQFSADIKKKSNGHVKKIARSVNETNGDRPAPKIAVTLYTAKAKDRLGSFEATPDTGAEATLAGTDILEKMRLTIEHLQSPPAENLVAANGQDLNCVGTLRCVIEYCGRQCIDNVYICENVDNFLLAWYMCKSLDILPRTYPQPIDQSRFELPTNSVSRVMSQDGKVCMSQEPSKTEVDDLKQALLEDYSDVFSDKGKLREMTRRPMKITLTEDVQPFALSAPRQIPFAYRNLAKAELEKQVAAGVIESVTEATDWVHPLVVVPKPKGGI